MRVYYSWPTDAPRRIKKGFIRPALIHAIGKDTVEFEAPTIALNVDKKVSVHDKGEPLNGF